MKDEDAGTKGHGDAANHRVSASLRLRVILRPSSFILSRLIASPHWLLL
jgi:hypothetical protein